MKTILFACYGSGHVRMVVPVAQAIARAGMAQVQVLGLTTAAPVVRASGLPLLQFKDFTGPGDEVALQHGRALLQGMDPVDDPAESAAYLGLSYGNWWPALAPRKRNASIGGSGGRLSCRSRR